MEDLIYLILGICRIYDERAAQRKEKILRRAAVNDAGVLRLMSRKLRHSRELCADLLLYLVPTYVVLYLIYLLHPSTATFLVGIAIVYILTLIANLLCWWNRWQLWRQILQLVTIKGNFISKSVDDPCGP